MTDKPLVTLRPSAPRLWFAVLALGLIGAVMCWIALAHPPGGPGTRALLLLGGGGTLWGAARLAGLRDRTLVLTEAALIDSRLGEVCRIDDIARVETGLFALKPARGFVLSLSGAGARHWVPGLWWRIGRSVGVGGMTGAVETRQMAEIISAMVMTRSR